MGETRIEQQVISHASLTIRTPDVGQAMIRAEGVATGVGGFVSSENTQADRKGKARTSSLVFRVPSSSFEATLRALRALGDLEAESTSRQDVTADVVDVQSRVASAKATISRIQVLLGRAQDLGDVIKLESELSTRQSDLEALEARLSYLSDQAAMSTSCRRRRHQHLSRTRAGSLAACTQVGTPWWGCWSVSPRSPGPCFPSSDLCCCSGSQAGLRPAASTGGGAPTPRLHRPRPPREADFPA